MLKPKYVALSILLPVLAALLAGCAVPVTKQAADLRDDSISQAVAIESAAQSATSHINNADQAVVQATSQPGNPAGTRSGLAIAHSELGSARVSLAPVATATGKIKSDAAAAYNVTAVTSAALQKEKSSFFSDKQKRLGLIAIGIMAVLGIVAGVLAYLNNTAGLPAIFKAATAVVWPVIKNAGLAVYHVLTLGLAWAGSEFGKLVASKAAAAAAPAGSPKTPLPPSPPLTPAPAASAAPAAPAVPANGSNGSLSLAA